MTLAERYILRRIIIIFPFALGVPFLIVWLIQLLRASGFLSSALVPMGLLLKTSVWGIPSFAAAILPFCAAISVTYAYHLMSSTSELVIMRSAGISPLKLARPGLIFGLVITVFGYFLSMYLVPNSLYKFRTLKYEIINSETLGSLSPGRFLPMPRSVVLFASGERREGDQAVLTGLFIHQVEGPDSVVVAAKEGRVFKTEEGFRVTADDGWRQQLSKAVKSGGKTTRESNSLRFGKYDFDFTYEAKPPQTMGRIKRIKEWSAFELISAKKKNNRTLSETVKRLLSPLYNLALVFLAAALGATAMFSRGHGYADLLLISGIALLAQLFNFGIIGFITGHSWGVVPAVLFLVVLVAAPLLIIRNKGEGI